MSTVGNKFAIFQIFNISLLPQLTEPRIPSVLLNSIGIIKKFTINLHYGDRLSYTQAEELSLTTVYRSQQLYTAEHGYKLLKKKWGNAIPFPFLGGVGTGGSGSSMNRGPRAPGAPE